MQVAVTVYYLSDKGRFRTTANAFGIAKNTVSMIIRRVTNAISNHLANKHVKIPRTEKEFNESCSLFFEKHGFSICEIRFESISQQKAEATMKYDREFQPPRQSGYDVSTNETGGEKISQTFVEYFENQ